MEENNDSNTNQSNIEPPKIILGPALPSKDFQPKRKIDSIKSKKDKKKDKKDKKKQKKKEKKDKKKEKKKEKDDKEEKQQKLESEITSNAQTEEVKKIIKGPSLDFLRSTDDNANEVDNNPIPVIVGPPLPTEESLRMAEETERLMDLHAQMSEKERWEQMKRDKESDKTQREEWMMSLPSGEKRNDYTTMLKRGNVKSFGDRDVPKLDPSWTRIPGKKDDNPTKIPPSKNTKPQHDFSGTKDYIEKYNETHRPKSLLEIHQSTDYDTDVSISKFDREKDMSRKKLDPTQRQKIINDSKNISSRFTGPKY